MDRLSTAGMTLIECITAISIAAVLACSAPMLSQALEKNREYSELFEFTRLLQIARSHAITANRVTTICGVTENNACNADWSKPTILIFEDRNENHRLDDGDTLIQSASISNSNWHWRGSNRPYLRYRNDGSPMEWGRFTRCPPKSDTTQAPQIVLNRAGRAYSTSIARGQLELQGLCSD